MSDGFSYTPALVSAGANITRILTPAETRALNSAGQQLVPAPGEGRIIVPRYCVIYKPAGVAGTGGGDLSIRYINGGSVCMQFTRASAFPAGEVVRSRFNADGANGLAASINTAVEAWMNSGNMGANDQPLTIHLVFDIFRVK